MCPLKLLKRYLNKKKTAEEMEQHYQKASSVDYSLKDGETLVLQIKNKSGHGVKSKFFEQQSMNNLSLEEKTNQKEPICIKPPPPPPGPLSPAAKGPNSPSNWVPNFNLEGTSKDEAQDSIRESKEPPSLEKQGPQDTPDDDFGDFQTAG